MDIATGQRWALKRGHDAERERYGDGAVVVAVYEVGGRRPHPGPAWVTSVDLDTDSGVALRGWSPSQLRDSYRPSA